MRRSKALSLPNILTYGRLIAVPAVAGLLFWPEDLWSRWAALAIFIAAAVTDYYDGKLARTRGLETNLGKLLDPLADKLLVAAVLISLVDMQKVDAWIAVVIISREFAITGLRQVALLEGKVVAASAWGKWKTGIQITMIIALLLNNFPFYFLGIPFDLISSWAAAAITIYSGIDYFVKNKNVIDDVR